jgi:hypothetical protein
MARRTAQVAQEIAGLREDLARDWSALAAAWDHLRSTGGRLRPVLELFSGLRGAGRPALVGFLSLLCLSGVVATVLQFSLKGEVGEVSRRRGGRE